MERKLIYAVTAGDLPATLGAYLQRQGYPAGLLASLRVEDGVRVNGAFRRMIEPLAAGEQVTVTLTETPSPLTPNLSLALTVRYEDEDILAVDKPPDMLVHPAGPGFDDSVGNFCVAHCPGLCFRPLGRLDRNTTGLVLIAKHRLAAAILTGHIDKTYYALAQGELTPDAGLIDAPLLRVGGPVIRQIVSPQGKPSRTEYQVLSRVNGLTFLRLRLLTGRTHQIRVHLQSLGHPLAGDALYGGSTALIPRQALHCGELRFVHPVTHQPWLLVSPLADDMARLIHNV